MISSNSFKFTIMFVLLIVGFLWSVTIGARQSIDIYVVLDAIFHYQDSIDHNVIWDIRISRSVAAIIIGLNYAIAGLALQAITRNELASPSVLGISQGAILFVSLGLLLPIVSLNKNVLAMLGAVVFGSLTFAFSGGFSNKLSPAKMVLVGVTVGAFAIALVRITFLLDDSLSRDIIAKKKY